MNTYAVLHERDFRNYLIVRLFNTLGCQTLAVAVAWQVYSLTKDPLSLGLIGLAEVVPAIGFALFAGHVVDRSDRRAVVSLAQLANLGVALFLLALSAGLIEPGSISRVHLIYGVVFCTGIIRAFIAPGFFAFFSQIVPRERYSTGAAWSTTVWQVSAASGPALGGLVYGFAGPTGAYAVVLLLFALSAVFLLRIPRRPRPESSRSEAFVESLSSGLRFVFRQKIVLSSMSLDLFAVLFGGAVALLPIFADRLGVGPQGLGLMRAAPAVGAALMALFLAHRPPALRAGLILLASVAGFGLTTIFFGLSQSFFFSLGTLAVGGALDAVSVIVRSTILQTYTPDNMRGRVSAVSTIFIASSNEIGAFESGVTAKWMGTVTAVVFGGAMTLVVVATTAFVAPAMRKLDLSR